MLNQLKTLLGVSIVLFSSVSLAGQFSITSSDIRPGKTMSADHEFAGFGCIGKNLSPHLKWENAPTNTQSFAVTVYDPDAPTGSGWWHWQLVNIPSSVTELATNAGSVEKALVPKGARQIKNDYGAEGFGGACPPKGHGNHRYQFTVYALAVKNLELPKDPSGALVGYMIKANAIDSVALEALYSRGM